MIEPAAESELDPSTTRLTIRVKLVPQEPEPPPASPQRLSKPALVILGVVAVLLIWLGVRTFRSDPTHTDDSAVVRSAPAPQPVTEAPARPVEPRARPRPDAPLSPVNEVIPDVPQSALNTIRGTIKVSVLVTIDKQGAVVKTATKDRGPSRYFERLAVDASKQWTFTPANLEERRTMLVGFNFTRGGVAAEASLTK